MTDSERTRARQKALVLLTDMDRTEAVLREKLKRSGFSEEAVEDAVAYVRQYGYVNDERYADHYIEIQCGQRSRRRIAADLREKKKLSGEEVDAAMERAGYWDERPLMRRLAAKKLRSLKKDDPGTRRKLSAYLLRQGFGMSDVISVTEEFLSAGPEEM